MSNTTNRQHNLRYAGDLHLSYPAVDREPTIRTPGFAATSPIVRRQPEPPSSETSVTILRDHSAYSDAFVELLKRTAADVEPVIANAPLSVQKRVESWCALHGYDSSDEETPTILAHQVVFVLLLRATLYEWHHRHGNLPEFADDVHENFQLASEQTDDSAFSAFALDEIRWSAEEVNTAAVIAARDRLLESTQPAADIGRLYEALIAGDCRRVLGQFRTPQAVGRLMRAWATSSGDTVLDPGMGAGELSTPFHPDWEVSADPDRVDGIDRSPLAALMGQVAQTISGQPHEVYRTDFFKVEPADLDRDVDAIICNPPYTRYELLSTEYRDELNAQAEEQTGLDISKTSPLYSYFYYHLRQFLDAGSRAAVLTPHHFLARDYGVSLKRFLLREFDVKALLLNNPENGSRFDTAQTTDVLVFLEATDGDTGSGVTRFIRVDEDATVRMKLDAVRNGTQGDTDWGFINCVEQSNLNPKQRWDSLFNPNSEKSPDLRPLSDLAEVHRGLQTGENDFFCLSQTEIDSWGIDTQYLSRMVPMPRYVEKYDVRADDWDDYERQERSTWLLYHVDRIPGVPETTYDEEAGRAYWPKASMNTDPETTVVEYLCDGLTAHETLRTRTTVHNRDPWYRVERGDPAPILVTSMGRSGFRAVLNETDARHLNSYHGIYPDATISRQAQKALLAYLNYVFAENDVAHYQRTLAGGLQKLEPGDVKDIPVIDPRELPSGVVATLAECFDELREVARHNQDETTVIKRIGSVLQPLL